MRICRLSVACIAVLLFFLTLLPTGQAGGDGFTPAHDIPREAEWGQRETADNFAAQMDRIQAERRERRESERHRPIRGIYMPGGLVGSSSELERILSLVERTELNSVVVDVKLDSGDIIYPARHPLAREAGVRTRISDLESLVRQFTDRDIFPIARIVVFKDDRIPAIKPEWAVVAGSGAPFRDGIGSLWVDPHAEEMWDYVIDIAKEAAQAGFWEIQFDYIRFPTNGNTRNLRYPEEDGRSKAEVVHDFLERASEELEPYGVLVSADVFGLVPTVVDDMGIGQSWDMLAQVVDILSPMTYPSHYGPGIYGIPVPDREPYHTVYGSLRDGMRRTPPDAVTIRPWLQDFSWGHRYGPEEVRAQIRATYDAGIEGWLLWNAGGRYTEGALEPARSGS